MTVLQSLPMKSGPFRLLKYFIITGFAVIAVVTILLSAFLYTRSVDTLVRWAENYARMLARNLNYNMYHNNTLLQHDMKSFFASFLLYVHPSLYLFKDELIHQ